MKRLLALCLLLAAVAPAWADTMSGIVFVVIDGDTMLFKPDAYGTASRAFLKIRLANIDAPEKDQPYGDDATRALSALVLNQRVDVTTVATDFYGRTIAQIQAGDVQVNTELVRRGLAWASRKAAMKKIQRDAQQAARGLWREASPMPPWVWRREHAD
ncbi:MAG TPA: thermonuclease family protein [Thiobacillus sp.]|nr:thermonuclease family protein [Thiobacillus sp.]HQT70582.1 thermonuclease family protein [Thiobacillus sp.]